MNYPVLNISILAISFLLLFGIAEILYHKLKVEVELTRKFVHIGTGLLTLLFPVMLDNHWQVLILCVSFALILIASFKFNFLKSINAIERKSLGSIAFPVSVYICFIVYEFFNHQYIFYYIPILILAICDPIATLFGKQWPVGQYRSGEEKKTLMGSGMFLITGTIIIVLLFSFFKPELIMTNILIRSILIASTATIAEGFSIKGYDNITIPVSVLLALFITEGMIDPL